MSNKYTQAHKIELPVNASMLADVQQKQYAVIDHYIPNELADVMLADANNLYTQGHFRQHYFQFGGALLKKPNVFELDLSGKLNTQCDLGIWKDIVCDTCPSIIRRIEELDSLAAGTPTLFLQTNTSPAIKLQINTGGGSFPWHFDNPGAPNKRILTCIFYLNPNWKEGDGGEIVLMPFLSPSITIPPLHGRAVFFFSDRVLHRVLPSKAKRVCFTMWCSGMEANAEKDAVLTKDALQFPSYDEAQRFFAKSPLQRVISRAVYSEEYLESLLECLVSKNGMTEDVDSEGATEGEKELIIKQHNASVLEIVNKLRPLINEFRKRKCFVGNL